MIRAYGWILLALPLVVGTQTRNPPYRLLVGAESEDHVALVEFRPCGSGQAVPSCGAVVTRTYDVGFSPVEIEGPHGVAASRDGKSFFVSIAHGRPYGFLLKYDLASGKLLGQVELGMFPATVDLNVAGTIAYAVNFNFDDPAMRPSSVSVVDVESMEEITRTTTCRMPHGSRLSPDGLHHYSACMMDDMLVDVDTRTGRVARTLRLSTGGHESHAGMAASCSPTWAQPTIDGRTVWVACNRSNEIVAVDVAAWSVAARVKTPVAPYNMDVTVDGKFMVVTQKGPGTASVWRLSDATMLAEIKGTRGVASGVAVSADSRYAFVTLEGRNAEPGTVDVIDLVSLRKVASVNTGKQAGGIAVLP